MESQETSKFNGRDLVRMQHAKKEEKRKGKKCLYESINVTIIIRKKKNTTNGILKIPKQLSLEFRNTATFHLTSIPSLIPCTHP